MGNRKNLIGSLRPSLDLRVTRATPLVLFEKKKKYSMLKQPMERQQEPRRPAPCIQQVLMHGAAGGQHEQLQVS